LAVVFDGGGGGGCGGGQIVSSFMNKSLAARKSRDKDCSLLPILVDLAMSFALGKRHSEHVSAKNLSKHPHTHTSLACPLFLRSSWHV